MYSPPGSSFIPIDGNNMGITMDDVVGGGGVMRAGQASSFTDGFHGVWTPSDSGTIGFSSFLPQPGFNMEGQTCGTPVDSAPNLCGSLGLSSTQPASHAEEVEAGGPKSVCTQNLTILLQDADRLWARQPLHSTPHMPRSQSDGLFLSLVSDKAATKSLLETFFGLAQRLIDAYPAAVDAAMAPESREPSSPCDVADCTHTLELGPILSELEGQISGQGMFSGPDLALAGLLVSCHTRLLDVLDRVLLLVASCTRATLACRREPDFDVSEMRVGAFVPQRPAAVLMQIALLKHLVAGLTRRLASFARAISSWAGEPAGERPEAAILRLQHELLAGRHSQKAAQVGVVEEFLTTLDISRA